MTIRICYSHYKDWLEKDTCIFIYKLDPQGQLHLGDYSMGLLIVF